MLIVKSNFNGDIRRFSIENNSDYLALTSLLRSIYQDPSLAPPIDHSVKYLDDEGDFVSIVCGNDLNLACQYASKLPKPLLRITIAANPKNGQESSPKVSIPLVEVHTNVSPSHLVSSGVKICGKEVFFPSETVQRYGPKKVKPEDEPLSLLPNNNEAKLDGEPKLDEPTKINANNINNDNKFSYQNFSDSTRKKNEKSAKLISSQVTQLGEQTAREIQDFAAEMEVNLRQKIQTCDRRANQDSAAMTQLNRSVTPTRVTDIDDSGRLHEDSVLLSLSRTRSEQMREVGAIREYHEDQAQAISLKATTLHDSTLLIVEQEREKLI